ncbi:MAG: ATP synthase F1 subunit delta [Chloroflexi bacterium]|nr:ATP synthase F1 subunit delta [Chloroflexota bacterium]
MAISRVARRYARAAFDIAVEHDDLDGWLRDLRVVRDGIGTPNVLQLLGSPNLPRAEKLRIVEDQLSSLDPLRVNLVKVLIANGRIEALPQVVAEFERFANDYRGIAIARATTALPLDESEAKRVEGQLSRLTGRRIVLQLGVDPTILGGLVVQIDDRLINGSVAGRLAALRADLAR